MAIKSIFFSLGKMYALFLQTGQTFHLAANRGSMASVPRLCSSGVARRPDVAPRTERVSLCLTDEIVDTTPLFTPIFTSIVSHDDVFHLVFYPDPSAHVVQDPLSAAYWQSILPMFLCRGIGEYYLGVFTDPNILRFVKSEDKDGGSISMHLADESTYNSSMAYGKVSLVGEAQKLKRITG